jgi:S1-C subfamily serine protease
VNILGVLEELSKEISDIVGSVKDSVLMIIYEKIDILDIIGLTQPIKGVGSGFIIGERLAVTNAHVVGDARTVKIVYPDGEQGVGNVIARDPTRDLALLAVDRRDIKPIKMGDSDKLRAGELVLAIGSPLGLPGPSVSLGVVSALGRTIVGGQGEIILEDMIQTDAAINPGNSGGPLVNLAGEAVGIATAIIPYAQGIGFAIPINHVKRFVHIISVFGRPVRAWIGVYVAQLTPEMAKSMRLNIKKGVVVVKVLPGTPAYAKGIRNGDIIIKAGGLETATPIDLRRAIEDNIDKGEIELEIVRRGDRYRLIVPIYIEEL